MDQAPLDEDLSRLLREVEQEIETLRSQVSEREGGEETSVPILILNRSGLADLQMPTSQPEISSKLTQLLMELESIFALVRAPSQASTDKEFDAEEFSLTSLASELEERKLQIADFQAGQAMDSSELTLAKENVGKCLELLSRRKKALNEADKWEKELHAIGEQRLDQFRKVVEGMRMCDLDKSNDVSKEFEVSLTEVW